MILASCQQHSSSEQNSCDLYYKRGSLIAQGGTGKVYRVKFHNYSAVVKEVVGQDLSHDTELTEKARTLGVAPPIYSSGVCERDGQLISYKITPELHPVDLRIIEAFPQEFEQQMLSALNTLHEHNITQGDIHLGNILYDNPEAPRFYLTDFDKGLDLHGIPQPEAQGHIDYENQRLQRLFSGEYFPPGGKPGKYERWQPFIYPWKQFDLNHDAKISDAEVPKLQQFLGSATRGDIAAKLYHIRMTHQLTQEQRRGLFADTDNDGELSQAEISRLSTLFPGLTENQRENIQRAYDQFATKLRLHFHSMVKKGSEREVMPGLEAKNILVITAGDLNPKRRFPLLTSPVFASLARNNGYRFEYFSSSLSAPWVPYWNKIWMLLDRMQDSENKVIVWLDDDGVASPNSDMIEQFLKAYPDKDFIVAMDPEAWATLNTGAIILRNTKSSMGLLLQTILVGLEDRTVKGNFRHHHLVSCGQDETCLHEQQALQELYARIVWTDEDLDMISRLLADIGVFNPANFGKRERITSRDWTKVIEVVPQIDPKSGRNLNVFFSPFQPYKLEGRFFLPSRVKIPYNLAERPFYMQPAGQSVYKYDAIKSLVESLRL
ncbi:MAG: hypothetical protein V4534_08415 [Myxococcota bacterium]